MRKNIKNWNDANHNFNIISWLLTGHLGNEHVLYIDAIKVRGTLEASQIIVGNETVFEDGYDPSEKADQGDVDAHNDDEHPHNVGSKIFLNSDGVTAKAMIGGQEVPTFQLSALDGSAYFRGEVAASSGNIGGWSIDGANGLKTGTGTNTRGISTGDITFYAGSSDPSSAKFRVDKSGVVTCSDIKITGGSMSILGRAGIDSSGSFVAASGKFFVDWDGDGVYNQYSGAARWKYTSSAYLYQSSSEFRVHFGPVEIFNADSDGNARVFGNLRYDGGLYYNGVRGIPSGDIRNGAITNSKIGTGAVDSDQLASGCVTAGKVGYKQIGGDKIYDGGVVTRAIDNNAVTSAKTSGSSTSITVGGIKYTFTNGLLTSWGYV